MPDTTDSSVTPETKPVKGVPEGGNPPEVKPEDGKPDQQPETFPRAYVEQLRQESAGYRTRAQQADALGERLHRALVTATGRLADPTDLPFDAAHLDDEAALTAAVDDLLARKPHLASRRPVGDIGQGATGGGQTVDLSGILRGLAS